MKQQKLEMDDLRVGMYVTILNGGTTTGMNGEICERSNHRSCKGKVLEIKAIDLPYVAVVVYPLISGKDTINEVLDFREVELMQLSNQYVKKLCPDMKINNSFWEGIDDDSLKGADGDIEEVLNKTSTERGC